MIERLQAIATFLSRFRLFIGLFGVIFAELFLMSLFEVGSAAEYDLLIPAIVGFCWAATLLSFASLFISIPAKFERGANLGARLISRIKRGLAQGLGLLMISLTVALVLLTYRLLGVWLGF